MHQPLRTGDSITFSAGIWRGSRVRLVQFITGSTPYHFSTNMAKATVNFQAVAGSSLAPAVTNKVSFVDTEADGYRNRGNSSYAHLLGEASEIVPWGERGRIVELVESVEG